MRSWTAQWRAMVRIAVKLAMDVAKIPVCLR